MARELGMNPRKLGKLGNHRQEPWKLPLPEFIEKSVLERFGRVVPVEVVSIEELARQLAQKKAKRTAGRAARRETGGSATAHRVVQLQRPFCVSHLLSWDVRAFVGEVMEEGTRFRRPLGRLRRIVGLIVLASGVVLSARVLWLGAFYGSGFGHDEWVRFVGLLGLGTLLALAGCWLAYRSRAAAWALLLTLAVLLALGYAQERWWR